MKIDYKICQFCGKYYDDKYCHCSKPSGKIVQHHLLEYYFTKKTVNRIGFIL